MAGFSDEAASGSALVLVVEPVNSLLFSGVLAGVATLIVGWIDDSKDCNCAGSGLLNDADKLASGYSIDWLLVVEVASTMLLF